jgi:hypothetical protein
MHIRVSRNTGWIGSGTSIRILANGENVLSVSNKREAEIEIPHENIRLKASQFGARSNEIEVHDGDLIKITSTAWNRWSYPVLMLLLFFTILLPSTQMKLMVTLPVGGLYVGSMFFMDTYHLEVQSTEENA